MKKQPVADIKEPAEAPVEEVETDNSGYIIPPKAVDANSKEQEVAAEAPKEEELEVEAEAPVVPEAPIVPEEKPPVPDDETLALETGRQVREYQKSHPGFDPFIMHREFTQRSMELAEYKKKYGDVNQPAPIQAQPLSSAPFSNRAPEVVAAEAGVDPETVKQFSAIAKSLGFVSKDELARQDLDKRLSTYEDVKQQSVAKFFEKYPQYHPTKDPTNVNWNKILGEYGLYKVPEDPTKILDLLERAHRAVSGPNIVPKSMKKVLAQTEANKTGAATGGGSGGSGKTIDAAKRAMLASGLKGFSDEDLDEMASS